jgi:HK97 family phage major capsid protein
LKTTGGLPIFKHILAQKPTLLDYPVYVSDFADPINTSGKHPILFGDWSYVFLRHIPGIELQKLQERYVDQYSDALVARKRADMQYACPSTSDSAIKMLSFS